MIASQYTYGFTVQPNNNHNLHIVLRGDEHSVKKPVSNKPVFTNAGL
jgi:hypothetical protein